MKIFVLVKQVPNTTRVKLDPKTGNLIREGVDAIINPEDRHALEAAVAAAPGDLAALPAALRSLCCPPVDVVASARGEVSRGVKAMMAAYDANAIPLELAWALVSTRKLLLARDTVVNAFL